MDDYFNLSPLDANSNKSLWRATPLELLNQAVSESPHDFTIYFIRGIVEAQKNMDVGTNNWCNVYESVQSVLNQFPENQRNFRPSAVDNVMNYIDLYQEYCN